MSDWWKDFCDKATGLPDDPVISDLMTMSVPVLELSCDAWAEPIVCYGKFSMEMPQMQNLPKCRIMLHPIMRNVYHIRNVEEATGLTAVARRGYVELVKL